MASQDTCLDIGVNEDDFACAGFSRDTVDALNAGIDETGYYFCHKCGGGVGRVLIETRLDMCPILMCWCDVNCMRRMLLEMDFVFCLTE